MADETPEIQESTGPVRRRHVWRWVGISIAAFLAVCVIVLALLDWNMMRGPLARVASARLHRTVRIDGDLNVHLFSWTPSATLGGLTIAQPGWAAQGKDAFAQIDRLHVALDLKALLGGHIVLPELDIDRPRVDLRRQASGRANWDFDQSGDKGALRLPPIRHFAIRDGHIAIADAKRKLTFTGTVASEQSDGSTGAAIFRLDGTGNLNGQPFLAHMQGDPLLDVAPDKPYGFTADIRQGTTRVEAKGALDTPFDFGAFHASLRLAGPNLADLYYLTGLALPGTPAYALAGTLARKGETVRFDGISGTVGKSDLKGDLSVDISGDRPFVTADLDSRRLYFDDLGPLIGIVPPAPGAAPVAASGTGKRRAASASQPDTRVLPDMPLRVERLRGMDASVHYRAQSVVSRDFPLRAAELKLSLKNSVLILDPIDFSFAQGTLGGTIRIDARKDVPVSDIDVRLAGLRLEQFFASGTGAGSGPPSLEGTMTARAKLHGTGNSVRRAAASADGTATIVVPHGEVRKAFAELLGINVASALGLLLTNDQSQTDVRCAVADFSAHKGVLNLDHLVFDTGIVSASGEGTVDLRNERLALAVTGHPKQPQLFRVRAPITIGGTLAKPAIGVNARAAIAQGGLAVGLAFVLTPLASVLPFVDPGLAKDADCAGLLKSAQTKGAPIKSAPAPRSRGDAKP